MKLYIILFKTKLVPTVTILTKSNDLYNYISPNIEPATYPPFDKPAKWFRTKDRAYIFLIKYLRRINKRNISLKDFIFTIKEIDNEKKYTSQDFFNMMDETTNLVNDD